MTATSNLVRVHTDAGSAVATSTA